MKTKNLKNKYWGLREMLQSPDQENWMVACTILEQADANKDNAMLTRLLVKLCDVPQHYYHENHKVLFERLEKYNKSGSVSDFYKKKGILTRYTYNELFQVARKQKPSPSVMKILVTEFNAQLQDTLEDMGYDFIKSIKVEYE